MIKEKEFLIGIDGGGTKTLVVLADVNGRILKSVKGKSSNPNKIGLKEAIYTLKKLIKKTASKNLRKVKIACLGLAGGLERDKNKKRKIEKELQKSFPFKIIVEGDQKIAFRAATDEKEGIVVIAGTGAISMGWRGKKEIVCGGWDWLLGDQGSGFWVGRRFLEEITKTIDGRAKYLKEKEIFLKKFRIKAEKEIYRRFYGENFVFKIAQISKFVDFLAEKESKICRKIFKKGADELIKMVKTVIEKLRFEKEKFPLVLVGGMFKSRIYLEEVKIKFRKIAPLAKVLILKKPAVLGAVKLARENF